MALVVGREMDHDHEREPAVRGNAGEQRLQGSQPPRGGPDAHHCVGRGARICLLDTRRQKAFRFRGLFCKDFISATVRTRHRRRKGSRNRAELQAESNTHATARGTRSLESLPAFCIHWSIKSSRSSCSRTAVGDRSVVWAARGPAPSVSVRSHAAVSVPAEPLLSLITAHANVIREAHHPFA
jgi:hypothetical protein